MPAVQAEVHTGGARSGKEADNVSDEEGQHAVAHMVKAQSIERRGRRGSKASGLRHRGVGFRQGRRIKTTQAADRFEEKQQ
ncbi:MAG: hypothetical protein BWX84_02236 [Verrucomicrobia bacterium ADurb.Bin118]|nr:MAG: hypothetical protein BWX84_02236 [Verrucomicrobia bacterium ADurb.Bin118]